MAGCTCGTGCWPSLVASLSQALARLPRTDQIQTYADGTVAALAPAMACAVQTTLVLPELCLQGRVLWAAVDALGEDAVLGMDGTVTGRGARITIPHCEAIAFPRWPDGPTGTDGDLARAVLDVSAFGQAFIHPHSVVAANARGAAMVRRVNTAPPGWACPLALAKAAASAPSAEWARGAARGPGWMAVARLPVAALVPELEAPAPVAWVDAGALLRAVALVVATSPTDEPTVTITNTHVSAPWASQEIGIAGGPIRVTAGAKVVVAGLRALDAGACGLAQDHAGLYLCSERFLCLAARVYT